MALNISTGWTISIECGTVRNETGLLLPGPSQLQNYRAQWPHLALHLGDDAGFRRQFKGTEEAKETVSKLRFTLELHREMHGC